MLGMRLHVRETEARRELPERHLAVVVEARIATVHICPPGWRRRLHLHVRCLAEGRRRLHERAVPSGHRAVRHRRHRRRRRGGWRLPLRHLGRRRGLPRAVLRRPLLAGELVLHAARLWPRLAPVLREEVAGEHCGQADNQQGGQEQEDVRPPCVPGSRLRVVRLVVAPAQLRGGLHYRGVAAGGAHVPTSAVASYVLRDFSRELVVAVVHQRLSNVVSVDVPIWS
mmetsp:Transcript_18381/g.48513  ORF Transcript_18381/g.48513 Transcript_18381/m.48513 type:complete len:226 (-) Transcript_18381:1384-2061(-)